jgi:hypothetical protein
LTQHFVAVALLDNALDAAIEAITVFLCQVLRGDDHDRDVLPVGPSIVGIIRSRMITSGRAAMSESTATRPFSASVTFHPIGSSAWRTPRRTISSSSAAHLAVPVMYFARDFPDDGGLISYGAQYQRCLTKSAFTAGRFSTGAPSSFAVWDPRRLRASGRDGR